MATTLVAMPSVRYDCRMKWHVEPTNGCGDCKRRVQCLQEMLRQAAHGPARFYFELFSIWMSEATYYTGWLCFGIDGIWSYKDPGEKYCLASTDWRQLVRLNSGPATCQVYEFWKWICKMFRNENRATMKLIARATTTTCATASLMWWREFCLEYNLKLGMNFLRRKW